jgi:hypothetical protein
MESVLDIEYRLLHNVFLFKNFSPPSTQNESEILELIRELERFKTDIGAKVQDQENLSVNTFSEDELGRIASAFQRMRPSFQPVQSFDEPCVWLHKWFPQYGCALLLHQNTQDDVLRLEVVALDQWSFDPSHHPSASGVKRDYSSVSRFPVQLSSGCIRPEKVAEFDTKVSLSINSAMKGDKIHKTPTFIAAIIENVLNGKQLDLRGGMTDVGQHTGSKPKATCWPLVQAVVNELLSDEFLYNKLFLHFDLFQLNANVSLLEKKSPSEVSQCGLDCAFKILDDTVLKALHLESEGLDMKCILEACKSKSSQQNFPKDYFSV